MFALAPGSILQVTGRRDHEW